ncbi:MAG: glucokinase [Chloroflexi bacterium]|nr:glucokinase [Chloroflexota bacterium]
MYLIGDVGGTKTNLAVFPSVDDPRDWQIQASYQNSAWSSLEDLLAAFIHEHNLLVQAVCLCVAGPVIDGEAAFTNLPWHIQEFRLKELFNIDRARIINDLVATALSIPHLTGNEVDKLNKGVIMQGGTIAVVAPGTGLGEAYLTWDGRRYRGFASEGGHVDFAPTSALQWGLLQYLQERYGHVSYERVCSGMGITNIYQFLKHTGYAPEPSALAEMIRQSKDPTPIIVNAALEKDAPDLYRAAVNTFVEILGAEVGNMALKLMTTGGVYLGGGIPPRILPFLHSEKFFYGYRRKGRFEDLLDRIPIHVILNPKAALLGCAYEIVELLNYSTSAS